MRRELPFQEIVPLESGIAVINAGNWFLDNLEVSLIDGNNKLLTKTYDKNGVCLFDGLINDRGYTVEIKRTDVKGLILYKKLEFEATPIASGSKYIILVGASVGQSWDFPNLGERVRLDKGIILGSRAIYEFDKTKEIDRICNLPFKPSAVIIKECSAYFPRDIDSAKKQVCDWLGILRSKGITPILATVVPVTKDHDNSHPNRFDSILAFNDSIRAYADSESAGMLDLEKALRISEDNRHLRPEYAQADGLHLVKRAYDEALDPIGAKLVKEITK